jgi:hypothetical protein
MVGIVPTVAGTLEGGVSGVSSSIICAWTLMLGSYQPPLLEPVLSTVITIVENNVKKRLRSFKFFLFLTHFISIFGFAISPDCTTKFCKEMKKVWFNFSFRFV